jgi:selenium-binding protein 1
MVLELRPAHNPTRAYGFASVVLSLKDLSSSIWLWYRDEGKSRSNGSDGVWAVKKVIEIPAVPADPDKLPPLLQGFKAVAPLVTDINLSVDDRYLYVSCWGLGEFIQYDVTDPFNPKKVSSLKLGGIVNRTSHPSNPSKPLNGGPQMVEVSRDGQRLYFSNSLYTPWDRQFYPDGVQGWIAKVNVPPGGGAMSLDENFFVETGAIRPHQVRLEGGDASSDSFCYA